MRGVWVCGLVVLLACGDDDGERDGGVDASDASSDAVDAGDDPVPAPLDTVPESDRFALPGLSARAYVVYTEGRVPHVYAENREDLARVSGFVVARDRFFEMDAARRLSMGHLSELLGQDALPIDQESRGTGMRVVAERILARFTDEQRALFAAYADGVNAYIEAVRLGDAPPPKEYEVGGLLLGASRPHQLMAEFAVPDIAALLATITYQLGYETTDLGRQRGLDALGDNYVGEAFADLRQAGLEDAFFRVTSPNGYTSATGWGLATAPELPIIAPRPSRPVARLLPNMAPVVDRTLRHLDRMQHRFRRDHDEGFGSNAWAVMGRLTSDGAAILAADGHLGGTVPTLFYRMGFDTRLLGGDLRQVGLVFPGVPMLAVGTNGEVAWNQTQHFGDITDWYAEEMVLDAEGAPTATRFRGADRPLTTVDESYEVADVPALGSVGRTEVVRRYETFDGRILTSIEGRDVGGPDDAGPGETAVNLLGDWVVPEDIDGDGEIRGVTFDYTGLDGPNFALTIDAWGRASSVEEMRAEATALVAFSQNIAAADASGSVLYLPYQVMPCRTQLERDGDGAWVAGAHPGFLIDGTRFGGFELSLTAEGRADESAATRDETCIVPLDEYPATIDPAQGFVVTSNNAPGTMAVDNDLTNDPHYIGGPWHEDFRAVRIDAMLRAEAPAIDEEDTARMQADVRSSLGALLTPLLLDAIEAARTAAMGTPAPGTVEERLAAMWTAGSARYQDVETRLSLWRDRGYQAASGVQTFYHLVVTPEEAGDAVATSLFNAWVGPFDARVLGDERFPPSTHTPTGAGGRFRVLNRMLAARGDCAGMADCNPATGESVFFDVLGTDPVETSEEVALLALDDALAFLESEPTGPGQGGFGSADPEAWVWGLRHHTRFPSLIEDFLGDDESFSFLADMFSIGPAQLPLRDDLDPSDPRADLPGFPRPGDNFSVDAANSGLDGRRFSYGAISVFRMVVALRGDETTGRNILPGGQSGIPGTESYDDQARLWLANETTPMRFNPQQVVAGAIDRETFVP